MKKKSLLILPIAFMLSACTITDPSTWFDFLKKKDSEPEDGDVIDGPDDMHIHATSLTQKPGASFILKVGEIKDISVSLSPVPDLAEERVFNWFLGGEYIDYVVDSVASNKVRITGKAEGTSYLTATNTYNPILSKTFTIKVIDVKEDDTYLWQYNSSNDLSKFDGKKTGRAYLGGMEWDFTRSKGLYNGTYYGALSFGKDKNPETSIILKAHTLRAIKSISIEAASMNSWHKMSVKVGETTFIDDVNVDRVYNDTINLYTSSSTLEPTTGDILIDISSEEYKVPEGMEPAEFKGPGTFWLKSITIIFDDAPETKTEKMFDFKAMYDDENDTVLHTLGTTPTRVSFREDNFEVVFASVKKEAKTGDKIPGYAHSNGAIDVKLDKANEVISKVEFKFTYGTTGSKNIYSLETSKTNGLVYAKSYISSNSDGLLKQYIFTENVNAIRFNVQNSYNVGLEYLKIYTRSGELGTINNIIVPEKFEPTKKEYKEGELFDPAGLNDLAFSFNEEGITNEVFSASKLEWYDGTSYETDPLTATKQLQAGTTSVYGVIGDYSVKVSNITVTSAL